MTFGGWIIIVTRWRTFNHEFRDSIKHTVVRFAFVRIQYMIHGNSVCIVIGQTFNLTITCGSNPVSGLPMTQGLHITACVCGAFRFCVCMRFMFFLWSTHLTALESLGDLWGRPECDEGEAEVLLVENVSKAPHLVLLVLQQGLEPHLHGAHLVWGGEAGGVHLACRVEDNFTKTCNNKANFISTILIYLCLREGNLSLNRYGDTSVSKYNYDFSSCHLTQDTRCLQMTGWLVVWFGIYVRVKVKKDEQVYSHESWCKAIDRNSNIFLLTSISLINFFATLYSRNCHEM